MTSYDGFENMPRWVFNNLSRYGNCLVDYNEVFLVFKDEIYRLAETQGRNVVIEKVERLYKFSSDGQVIIWLTKERKYYV